MAEKAEKAEKPPLYPTLLRLQHVHPNAWQRALLGEGMALLGALLVMADLASGWAILVLPLAMAAVVKGHDVLAGFLAERPLAEDEATDGELAEVRVALESVRRELSELLSGTRGEPAGD